MALGEKGSAANTGSLQKEFEVGQEGYEQAIAVSAADFSNLFNIAGQSREGADFMLRQEEIRAENGTGSSVAVADARASGSGDTQRKAREKRSQENAALQAHLALMDQLNDRIEALDLEINFLGDLAQDMQDWDQYDLTDEQLARLEKAREMLGVDQETWDDMSWEGKIQTINAGEAERTVKREGLVEAQRKLQSGQTPEIVDNRFVNDEMEAAWLNWVAENPDERQYLARDTINEEVSEYFKHALWDAGKDNEQEIHALNQAKSENVQKFNYDTF